MIRIGEVAEKYEISHRTLRYWEESGILKSNRNEKGYRFYSDDNILRIKQISILRKFKLPIKDIKKIFLSNSLSTAIEILEAHLERTNSELIELEKLSLAFKQLINLVKQKYMLSEFFDFLNECITSSVLFDYHSDLSNYTLERNVIMNKDLLNVRIVKLPRMLFACHRAESETPEIDCSKVTNKFILENNLHQKTGFRHFGFNNPDPTEGKPIYGYEMQFVIPDDLEVPKPLYKKEYEGGLFAALATKMTIIGEQWKTLYDWTINNPKYEIDWSRNYFEECIDYETFMSDIDEDEKQLDLLIPIKTK
jgi:DNA-binding transcriptional MerR regulator